MNAPFYRTVILTGTDRHALDRSVIALTRRLSDRDTEVYGVLDPGRGNLFGTLNAWRVVHSTGQPKGPILILHDAGQALRCAPLTTHRSRGALAICTNALGRPVTLNQLIIESLRAFCPRSSSEVHVFWGSQLLLISEPPPPLQHVIAKFTTMGVEPMPRRALEDLGVIGMNGERLCFKSKGSFTRPEALRSWARSFKRCGWDLGSFAISAKRLHTLANTSPDTHDAHVDTALYQPLARRGEAGLLPVHVEWHRVRRPEELLATSLSALRSPALRRLMRVQHPVSHSHLGEVYIEGPEISWRQMTRGLSVGGVWLQGSILRGVALQAGSRVKDSVIEASLGQLIAEDARVFRASVNHATLKNSLVYEADLPPHHHAEARLIWTDGPLFNAPLSADSPPQTLSAAPPLPTDAAWLLSDNPLIARAASAHFFRGVIQAADQLNVTSRRLLIKRLCQTWAALSKRAPLHTLQIQSADALLQARAHQQRARRPIPNVRQIALLSRVTVGADLCINLPLIAALRAQHPEAKIALIGATSALRFPVDQQLPLPVSRSGELQARLNTAIHLRDALQALSPDLIVNPDSRLDQLGTLPVYATDRALYLDTCCDGQPIGERALAELSRITGAPLRAPRAGLLPRPSGPSLPPDQLFVGLKFDVGANENKRRGLSFERALIDALLAEGLSVLIDEGHSEQERAQSERRLHGFGHRPVDATRSSGPQLLTYSGDLNGWAACLAQCALSVQYDSVNGHLASALGVRAITLFSHEVPLNFVTAWTPIDQDALRFSEDETDDALLLRVIGKVRQRIEARVHPDVVDAIVQIVPKTSAWTTLSRWLRSGRYRVGLEASGSHYTLALSPAQLATFNTQRSTQAHTIVHDFAQRFLPCEPSEARRLSARLFQTSAERPSTTVARCLSQIERFSLKSDADRTQLAAHYEALSHQRHNIMPALSSRGALFAWLRYLIEHEVPSRSLRGEAALHFIRRALQPLSPNLRDTLFQGLHRPATLNLSGAAFAPEPLPVGDWPRWLCAYIEAHRIANKTLVIGLIGPCGVGKSHLVAHTLPLLRAQGLSAVHLSADAYLWPAALRYRANHDGRQVDLSGPAIYQHRRLARDIEAITHGRAVQLPDDPHGERGALITQRAHVILTDGVAVGFDRSLYEQLHRLVGLFIGDDRRLAQKQRRDDGPNRSRQVHVAWDYTQKQFIEYRDVIHPTYRDRAHAVLDGDTDRVWRRQEAPYEH